MPRQIGRLRAWCEVAALAPPWAILRGLPLERAVKVGAAFGTIAMAADYFNRKIGMRNLGIAFPELNRDAHRKILHDTYRNFGRMAAEWLQFLKLDAAEADRYVGYTGREYWREAIRISAGRGILILTGHFGNFELLSLGHSLIGSRWCSGPIAIQLLTRR